PRVRPPVSTLFPYTTLFRSGPVVPAVEVVADGFGVEGGAVVERDVGLQLEGVRHAVLGRGPGLGEQRCGVGRAGLGADETLEDRSEEHTSELQSRENLVCRL